MTLTNIDATPRRGVGRTMPRRAQGQAGMGLIEVLIAVLVLGLGLLGVAAMQSLALRNSQSSLERSQAVIQAYAMAEAMRANAAAAKSGAYDTGSAQCFGATASGGSDLAAADRANWVQALGESLGKTASTCGKIACAADSCSIEVVWDDTRGGGAGGENDADKRTFRMQVRL
ncbi:type IV pilus modification protein PilV [Lysobacter sp. K5869]|uniref:type IV pilus modification protein PilV n=1 Tax=Lysobacter sp. K5869 TaxID=2820808 RepID=UPI001C061D37|nr:type IV pilus modification protein PilV [Lysobacter sp. K5869]QWP79370.1 type IV pilus modification protein PilV [Lysobacter sp. K5869]